MDEAGLALSENKALVPAKRKKNQKIHYVKVWVGTWFGLGASYAGLNFGKSIQTVESNLFATTNISRRYLFQF